MRTVWLLILLIFWKKVNSSDALHISNENKNVFSTKGTYRCTVDSHCIYLSTKVLFLILFAWKISPQSALSSKFLKIFQIFQK